MPYYRQILSSSLYLIAWWFMSMHAYASMPSSLTRVMLLTGSSLILLLSAFNMFKAHKKISACFTLAYALSCWIFYAECLLLALENSPQWTHIVTIYNLLRFFLMAMVFFILLKEFFRSIKDPSNM